MTAPMTRERLALIRDGYKPALDDSYSEACVAVDVEDLRELLDACESLLAERESVRDAALEEAAKHFEAAAEAIEANARDPNRPNVGCTAEECLDAAQDKRSVAGCIRALKGKR